ncbi:uncharacterized protein TNCV_670961 [Trichonephila clavipes]|nr:uncharacterized protein TNCV_670961 [Trichonephila clavipes]
MDGGTHLVFLQQMLPVLLQSVSVNIKARQWNGRGGPVNWLARSPDLSCLDFFLWGHMKNIVYASFNRLRRDPGCEDCRRSRRYPGDARGIC